MEEEAPKVSTRALLVYLTKRIDEMDGGITDVHITAKQVSLQLRKYGMQSNLLTIGAEILRYSSYFCTVFIASYVSFEHTWYVEKIGSWLHKIFSWTS